MGLDRHGTVLEVTIRCGDGRVVLMVIMIRRGMFNISVVRLRRVAVEAIVLTRRHRGIICRLWLVQIDRTEDALTEEFE
jgi:hypothetical protein